MSNVRKNYRGEVLSFVESFMKDNGYAPTLEEIRESVGLSSKSHVDYYLDALEQEGLIERTPRTPRGLRTVGLSRSTFGVNVEGTTATGQPLELADGPRQEV